MKIRSSLFLLILLLAACTNLERSVTRVVEVTRLVPVTGTPEQIEVTRVVPATAEATREGEPAGAATRSPRPDTLIHAVDTEPVTLDPALAMDPAGRALIQNVLETLVYPHPHQTGVYLPLLATEWEISEDGRTYIFQIREDVTFSNGSALTPSDIAYSIHRALLQSSPGGPQGLLLEPLLGYVSGDVTEEIQDGIFAGDQEMLLANAAATNLVAVCERVRAAVVADDEAGTLTFNLEQPWGPLLVTLSQPWTGAIDRDWAISQGAWDDSCESWAQWYAPDVDGSPLANALMGSGPYLLDHWTPGIEYVLAANPNYWRSEDEPLWPGPDAPRGTPAVQTVVVTLVEQEPSRLLMLQQGLVDIADVVPQMRILADQWVAETCNWQSDQCEPAGNANGSLRKIIPIPSQVRTDILFNFAIPLENNPMLGSSQLDGQGIPSDFFTDLNVRRGFNHCLDVVAVVEEAYAGLALVNNSVIPPFLIGHDPNMEARQFDLQACTDSLAAAWEGQLPQVGFRLQVPFVTGSVVQEAALANLQANLRAVNPLYRLEMVGLPEPLYMDSMRNGRPPLIFLEGSSPLPDPHPWAQTYLAGEYADYQHLPADLRQQLTGLVQAGVAATLVTGRERIYSDLGRVNLTTLPNIILPQPAGAYYQQMWMTGGVVNPALPDPYYYGYRVEDTP